MNTTRYTTISKPTSFRCSLLLLTLLNPFITKAQFSLNNWQDLELSTTTGAIVSEMRSCDMNNDGKMDLVLCFTDINTVQIFLNNSTAKPNIETSFLKPYQINYTGGTSGEFYLSDLNRDALPEIIISNAQNASIIILRNTSSTNKLSFSESLQLETPQKTTALSACDLNGDGLPELMAASGETVYVFQNSGVVKSQEIKLNSMISLSGGGIIHDIKCADMDGDGNADIITGTHNGISVLKNQTNYGASAISFANAVNQNEGRSVFAMDIGDLDNDFKPDIVTSNWPNADISILPNTSQSGNISFGSIEFMEAGSSKGIALGDFDQDGKFDVAVSTKEVTKIFRNISSAEGDFSLADAQNFPPICNKLMVKDFDRDGVDDLGGFNFNANKIELLLHSSIPVANAKPEFNVYCGEDGKIWMDWNVPVQNKAWIYDIEKTTDGINFNPLAVQIQGETVAEGINFSYSDTNESANIEYYRLKITSTNGEISYTDMEFAEPCTDVITGFVCSYPNPVDKVMNFNFSLSREMEMTYSILDLNMQVQLEKTELVTPGTRTYSLEIMQLQKGSYIFVVKFGNLPPKVCRFEKL